MPPNDTLRRGAAGLRPGTKQEMHVGGSGRRPALQRRVVRMFKTVRCALALTSLLMTGSHVLGAETGWTPLFNGRDLSGWVKVNCAPHTFSVRDGLIISTGVPTGVMRTDRQYENFELELEYRHMKA